MRDQDHVKAVPVYEKMLKDGWRMNTTNWTLYDALSHIKERGKSGGLDTAKTLDRTVNSSDLVTVIPITKAIERRALDLFWAMEDKAWSITTCANIVVIRDLCLRYVLSANAHYRQTGLITLY